jgi:hypothetical protein
MLDHLRRYRVYWLLALLTLGGYAVMRVWFPLAPNALAIPLPDVSHFVTWPELTMAYAGLICVQFALYWLAYREVRANRAPSSFWAVWIPALVFAIVLVGTFTINATDLHRYVMHARVQAVYGLNPYTTPLSAIPNDPYRYFAGEWIKETTPYGPVWQLVSLALVRLSGDDFARSLWLFKGVTAGLSLAVAGFIWLALPREEPSERLARVLLWAWNPALWLIFAVDGHNDSLVLFWLVLGWVLIRRGRPAIGLIVMALGPLVKMSGLLPIPFFVLGVWHSLPDLRARVRVLAPAAAGMAAVTVLVFLPFGSPLALGTRLVREASQAGGFSPLALVVLATQRLGLAVPIDRLLGAAGVLLGVAAVWIAWRTWRGRSPLRAAADINVAYLVLAFGFRIWYVSWVFPWLVLDRSDRRGDFRLRAGLWFLLITQLSVLIYGRIRYELLGNDITLAHVVGIPFVFGLPLLLAYLGGRKSS